MRYENMLYDAINQVKQTPRQTVAPVKKPIAQQQVNLDSLASKIIENLLEKVQERLPAQEINITNDTKHLEALIEKLQELVAVAPSVNVAAPDHSLLAEAMIAQGEQIAKLGRLLTKKQNITCSVLRDEDGKMAQIIIERD